MRAVHGPALAALAVLAVLVQGFGLGSLAALTGGVAALVAAGVWQLRAVPAHGRAAPTGVLLAAYSAWLVVCAQLSPAAPVAQLAVYTPLLLPLSCAALVLSPEPEAAWRWIRRAVAGLSVFLALYVVGEAVLVAQPDFSGLFVQRNSLGGYLLLAAFVLTPELVGRLDGVAARRRARWHGVAIFLALFVVSLSSSRGALGALVLALAGFYCCLPADRRRRGGRLLVALALWAFLLADLALKGEVFDAMASARVVSVEVVLPGLAALTGGDAARIREVAERWGDRPDGSKVASANERFLIWSSSLAMLRDAPWHGFGPGTFRHVYPAYALPEDTSSMSYAHNDLLQAAVELGLPGAGLLAALAAAIVLRWRAARARSGDVAVDGLFWALAAVSLHGLFSYNFHVPATLVLTGLVLARLLRLTRTPLPEDAHVPPWWRRHLAPGWLAVTLFVCVALVTAPLAAAAWMAREYERGVVALVDGRLGDAARALGRASVISPNGRVAVAQAHVFMAGFDASGKGELLDAARERLAAAERMNPFSVESAHAAMLLALREGPPGPEPARAAREAFEEALRRDPRAVPVRVDLARALLERGHADTARAVLERGLERPIADQPLLVDYLAMLEALRRASDDERGAREAARERERLIERLGQP